MMAYKPAHVANAILHRAKKEGVEITPLKLQKLMYYLNGWHLATRGEPLVGERFEAWPYGPVLSSIYQEFKTFGSKPITEYASEVDPSSGAASKRKVSDKNTEFYLLFDKVWNKYKSFSPIELSNMTHAESSPWDKARDSGKTYLSDSEIKEYFKKLAKGGVKSERR